MNYVDLVAAIAILQFLFFGAMTGRARRISGLKAPAITGDEGFERMYRVQMNSLEFLVPFLPALYLADKYWPMYLAAIMGGVYVLGRFIYWRAYVADPASRGLGFLLTLAPTAVLVLLALAGPIKSLFAS